MEGANNLLMDCGCIPIKKVFLRSQRSDCNDKRGEPGQCSVRGFGVIRISESGHHCAYSYPNQITRGATDWFTRYRQCISKRRYGDEFDDGECFICGVSESDYCLSHSLLYAALTILMR